MKLKFAFNPLAFYLVPLLVTTWEYSGRLSRFAELADSGSHHCHSCMIFDSSFLFGTAAVATIIALWVGHVVKSLVTRRTASRRKAALVGAAVAGLLFFGIFYKLPQFLEFHPPLFIQSIEERFWPDPYESVHFFEIFAQASYGMLYLIYIAIAIYFIKPTRRAASISK